MLFVVGRRCYDGCPSPINVRRVMAELSAELKDLLGCANLVIFPEDYFTVYLPVGIKAIPGEWFRPATTKFAVVIQEQGYHHDHPSAKMAADEGNV